MRPIDTRFGRCAPRVGTGIQSRFSAAVASFDAK